MTRSNVVRRDQITMLTSAPMTLAEAMEQTADSLNTYGERFADWAIAYSGGKDSTATLTAVVHLIRTGRVRAPRSLTVLYADTRMELPPLQASALRLLETLQKMGIRTQVVLPEMDERFFVYMFGRGIPPPKNRFRWCTDQLKIEPMARALRELQIGQDGKFLVLTGVRMGESAVRDQRISLSCSRDGAECGQGWFQESLPTDIADTLAPLLHWRVCHVWDHLMLMAADHDFPVADIAEIYGLHNDGSAEEISARTGCVGCNLASKDVALERILRKEKWQYLSPLRRLRPLYEELKQPHNRLRKFEETKADGTPSGNPFRMGPLTMEARRKGITEVIGIQDEIGAAANGRPEVCLIDQAELSRIYELIGADTWPQKWTGDEMTGDALVPIPGTEDAMEITRRGGRQVVMGW
jgi:DNA sulfur modification protein DndC